jgi:hypothetical protein
LPPALKKRFFASKPQKTGLPMGLGNWLRRRSAASEFRKQERLRDAIHLQKTKSKTRKKQATLKAARKRR